MLQSTLQIMNQCIQQSWTNVQLTNTSVQQNHQQAPKSAGTPPKRKKKTMFSNTRSQSNKFQHFKSRNQQLEIEPYEQRNKDTSIKLIHQHNIIL